MCEVPKTIVVLSHLRWTGVWQRPQQLLARLAKRGYRVIFIEEMWAFPPDKEGRIPVDIKPRFVRDTFIDAPEIYWPILFPQDEHLPQLSAQNLALYRQLITEFMARKLQDEPYVLWCYSPMQYEYLKDVLQPSLVAYDCMDHLGAFRNAPAALTSAEEFLLAEADVVFAGGRSIQQVKQPLAKGVVHQFNSAIDPEHFGKALDPDLQIPADIATIPKPIIGWAGVIDERVDYAAVRAMSEAHPDWSIVLVGPVAKVKEEELPRAANIHYLGQRNMADLPAYIKAMDVATLLFAESEATRHLSPTKTPEYLAAGRPVVSGPVPDVEHDFGDVAVIAHTPDEWISAVEHKLTASSADEVGRGLAKVRALRTWDQTVDDMERLIVEACVGA
jgi:UDP-galactopyranose mutase